MVRVQSNPYRYAQPIEAPGHFKRSRISLAGKKPFANSSAASGVDLLSYTGESLALSGRIPHLLQMTC
jgi:hypothetical protein